MDAGKEKESSLNLTFLKKIPWLKILKMTVGAVMAMELAGLLHLEYAASAGVIAFLTIQDTRQETSSSALRRGIAFCIMTLLCLPIFSLLGNQPWAFGIFFPLFLLICFTCRMEDSIAVNTVLATHYMAAGGVSLPMLKNECGLLLVGVGLGILLNSFMPNNLRRIQAKQSELDTELQQILHRMAIHVLKTEHPDYDGSCFHRTDQLLTEMEQETVRFMRNHYLEQDLYFMQYLMMRREQCEILRMIYRQICKLTLIPTQAKPLSDYLQTISDQYHETNDAVALLEELDALHRFYQEQPLPETREQFENRAILYAILSDLRSLLQIKQQFSVSLPKKGRGSSSFYRKQNFKTN